MSQEDQLGLDEYETAQPEEEDVSVSEPDGEESGQPDFGHKESPEDIAKARAYYQTKAQEEAERRKALEQKYQDASDRLSELTSAYPKIKLPAQDLAQEEPSYGYGDDIGGDEYLQYLNKGLKKIEDRIVRELRRSEELKAQEAMQSAYDKERESAIKTFNKLCADYEIAPDVVSAAVQYASELGKDFNQMGGPSSHARLALEYIKNQQIQEGIGNRLIKKESEISKKYADIKKVQQPSGTGGTTPPQPKTPYEYNKALADMIAPDDPVID